jgi:hypothetical protein
MEFKDLYKFCDETIASRKLAGGISVVLAAEVKQKLIESIDWLGGINFYPVECQDGDPHGHYECFDESETRWDDATTWVAVISYDKTLNDCGCRFVWFKEMMHIFDTVDGLIGDEASYLGLIGEIELRPLEPSVAYKSENFAKWMALLLLCPKSHRDQIIEDQASNTKTYYQIALDFRIPENVVPSLFSPYYDKAYSILISN